MLKHVFVFDSLHKAYKFTAKMDKLKVFFDYEYDMTLLNDKAKYCITVYLRNYLAEIIHRNKLNKFMKNNPDFNPNDIK